MEPDLSHARRIMDSVFALVRADSFYERPIPARHRIVFYLGHVEAFDRNLLGAGSVSAELDRLFAFGIDPPTGQLPSDPAEAWPSMDVVHDYVEGTRAAVDRAWASAPELLCHVAVEHRLMHAETFTYMLHNMDPERLTPPARRDEALFPEGSEVLSVEEGVALLGQHQPGAFGWDNEFAPHAVHVPAFRIDARPVSNADWLRFVDVGGPVPHFWRGRSHVRSLFVVEELPLNAPVFVTQRQAEAYAKWQGARLPGEAEWHRSPSLPWGWEWTSTLFRPFEGFRTFDFYPGYSADFFDDDHYVLKGGSPVTDTKFLRPSFRNWFRADYPYVYATFRCVR